jgi:hypothetical protein
VREIWDKEMGPQHFHHDGPFGWIFSSKSEAYDTTTIWRDGRELASKLETGHIGLFLVLSLATALRARLLWGKMNAYIAYGVFDSQGWWLMVVVEGGYLTWLCLCRQLDYASREFVQWM